MKDVNYFTEGKLYRSKTGRVFEVVKIKDRVIGPLITFKATNYLKPTQKPKDKTFSLGLNQCQCLVRYVIPKGLNIIQQWRDRHNRTFQKMSDMSGISLSHITNVIYGNSGLSPEKEKTVSEILKLEDLIAGYPADVVLLKYELETLTGVSL